MGTRQGGGTGWDVGTYCCASKKSPQSVDQTLLKGKHFNTQRYSQFHTKSGYQAFESEIDTVLAEMINCLERKRAGF